MGHVCVRRQLDKLKQENDELLERIHKYEKKRKKKK
jgi:hypothetical protein